MPWLPLTNPRIAPAVLRSIEPSPGTSGGPSRGATASFAGPGRQLREVLAGTRPRANDHFDILVNFARTMYRVGQLEPNTAAGQPGRHAHRTCPGSRGGRARWIFDARIHTDAFAKLQFRDTFVGIGNIERENREGWWSHTRKNRAFIEGAVQKTQGAAWP